MAPESSQPGAGTANGADAPRETALRPGHGFGTGPVFLASICTILGAVLFLRFGYAVGHAGLGGALLIVLLGHMVTVPTALAVSEIATNRRVEGGGEYFIISRSFGTTIGASIGLSLYLSQAISVAFYMIAFAEAFRPLGPALERAVGLAFDPRLASLPATLLLVAIVLVRGANLGVKALWAVAAVLGLSLALFFLGEPSGAEPLQPGLFDTVEPHDPFMLVFAIVFPAFTGMTAGVGLSGDLANPRRSIPFGILSATLVGMVVYAAAVAKLAYSADPGTLAREPLVMSRIAVWGPIVPIGLACATLSSAIGSILVAPRTLQALGGDRVLPGTAGNQFLRRGHGPANEPRNATLVTGLLALATVAVGSVDFVARIISMFFMVTYGAICAISFLEHFAARPSYRPSFRSKWYLSLFGAATCFLLMFQMDPFYALLAILLMTGTYRGLRAGREGPDDLGAILRGVMTQATRYTQVTLQKRGAGRRSQDWRPSLIMVDARTFERSAPLRLFTWLSHRYGFGTYLHLIRGALSPETFRESRKLLPRLIAEFAQRGGGIYVDTMISPSMRSALAQTLQIPGISGMDNNTVLFEFSVHDGPEALAEVAESCRLAAVTRMNSLVLRHGDRQFGTRSEIHLWLSWHDHRNASLMILLAYILLGHPEWSEAEVRIFAAFPQGEVEEQTRRLTEMISTGRLPISPKNLRILGTDDLVDYNRLVESRSGGADLVILGFTEARLEEKGPDLFRRHPALGEVLFVNAQERILIE